MCVNWLESWITKHDISQEKRYDVLDLFKFGKMLKYKIVKQVKHNWGYAWRKM